MHANVCVFRYMHQWEVFIVRGFNLSLKYVVDRIPLSILRSKVREYSFSNLLERLVLNKNVANSCWQKYSGAEGLSRKIS